MALRSVEEAFRRLTIGDAVLISEMGNPADRPLDTMRLDARTETLLRIGALVALDAPPSSYRAAVNEAQVAGARLEDLLAVLMAVAASVGSARVISAAPRIALAAGYDVEAALESVEPPDDVVDGPKHRGANDVSGARVR